MNKLMTLRQWQYVSYLVSFLMYTWLLSWKVALLLMVGIGFHEYGHLWAAKKLGMETRGFFLIPFIGGAALIKLPFRSFANKVMVSLAGPLAGTLLSVVCYGLYQITHLPFLGSAAMWMLAMNALNLIPLAMLDGGQVGEAVAYSISPIAGVWFLGVSTLLAGVGVMFLSPLLGLFLLFFSGRNFIIRLFEWRMRRLGYGDRVAPLPKQMDQKQITISVCAYLLLVIGILCLIMGLYNPAIDFKVLFQ